MVGDETSAAVLGLVKAGEPMVRGQHGPAERANMAEAEANKIPAAKSAKAIMPAAKSAKAAAVLGSVKAGDRITRGQLTSLDEARARGNGLRGAGFAGHAGARHLMHKSGLSSKHANNNGCAFQTKQRASRRRLQMRADNAATISAAAVFGETETATSANGGMSSSPETS